MSLKGDRYEVINDISFFMGEVAQPGGVVVIKTAGSGAAMDQNKALVTYAANPSGCRPQGILMTNMVNIDQTRQHINWMKDEVQLGGKVTLLKQGYVVTNMIVPGVSPAGGNVAYLGVSGLLTSTCVDRLSTPAVGEFTSSMDEDGYAKVTVNLPQTY
jgi:hypothetical protein